MENIRILKNGVRLLRPSEYRMLHEAIPKIENRDKLDALLFTGCRYSELRWLKSHESFVRSNTILMPSRKAKARHKERYIRLNAQGQRAVAFFLRSSRNLPTAVTWLENLKRWAEKAGIGSEGISCKTTRKTWEAWLATMYPNNFTQIFLSQGHTEKVSLEYYLMLPYTTEDKEQMRIYTDGWL